jgi:hypothetical protein
MKTAIKGIRRQSILALLLLLGVTTMLPFAGPWVGVAQAAQAVYGPTCNPEMIFTGIPTTALVTVQISYDPNLVSSSVNLLRVKPDGSNVVVSRMYDDGTHGDAIKDDGSYSTVIDLNEPYPGTVKFRVSAGYKGQARRVLSDIFTLEVQPYPNLEQIWNQFVAKLVNKDMDGALLYMRDARRNEYRRIFSEVGMDKVAKMFASARDFRLKEIVPDRAECTFVGINRGKEEQGEVVFWLEREWDDVWRIDVVGF